ncbi:pyrimidine dimer DNA glycosylase/endonuclease V [Thermodesulfobacteriota bacterium]
MRLWSIHPKYLDSKGLVALWREGLLAQKVLQGMTKGYRNHPQLKRFKITKNPEGAIAGYLRGVIDEAGNREYKFDRTKISEKTFRGKLPVTAGQLEYEFFHLLDKLRKRDPEKHIELTNVEDIETHPVFYITRGDLEDWEVVK